MKKIYKTIMLLLVFLVTIGVVSGGAQAVSDGWHFSSTKTWNPGACSARYYGQAYFSNNAYQSGGEIVITEKYNIVTTYSTTTYNYTTYVILNRFIAGSNNATTLTCHVPE